MKIAEQSLKEASYNLFGSDIKEKIDFNNELIEKLINPNKFTLNNDIAKLLKENEMLQAQCIHEFEGGYCKYCYKRED